MRNLKAIIKGIQDHNAMSDEPKKDIDFSKRLSSDEEKTDRRVLDFFRFSI